MTPAELSIEVKKRIGVDRLVQLTNYLSSATTVNDTVLDAAGEDAIGAFRVNSGFEPNSSFYTHISILVKGVQFFLESYKGRDSGLLSNMEKAFFLDCRALREKSYSPASSNSNLTVDRERVGTRPDMQRNRPVLNLTRTQTTSQSLSEVAE